MRGRVTGLPALALAAHLNQTKAKLKLLQPPTKGKDRKGRDVVFIRNWRGIISAYRQRTDGRMKQLRPQEVRQAKVDRVHLGGAA